MADFRRLPGVEDYIVPAIKILVEVGMPAGVERMTRVYAERIRALGKPESVQFLEETLAWLAAAKQHEAVHGPGSLLNREHPRYVSVVIKGDAGRPVPEQFRYSLKSRRIAEAPDAA